jgi:hypothetical protein
MDSYLNSQPVVEVVFVFARAVASLKGNTYFDTWLWPGLPVQLRYQPSLHL